MGVRPPSSDIALPDVEIPMVYLVNTCFGLAHVVPAEQPDSIRRAEPGGECGLSVRAINVLKILADEIMGETPPRDAWIPPEDLLRKITVERLSIARNCGPRTVEEIIRWAEARGVTIQPAFHAGKSLSETWRKFGLQVCRRRADQGRARRSPGQVGASQEHQGTRGDLADSPELPGPGGRRSRAALIAVQAGEANGGRQSTDIAGCCQRARAACGIE